MLYVWDEYDVFGDSTYSQNVRDRIMLEWEPNTSKHEWFWQKSAEKRYKFAYLFDFSLAPWMESHDTRDEEVYINDITLRYFKIKENAFTKKFKRKYRVNNQSFKEFVKSNYNDLNFKPTVKMDDFTYWKLFYGLTYPVYIPYHLETLYRKEVWNFLRSYYFFNFDLPWEIWIMRSSIENHMVLNKMDFFGVNYFDV